MEKPISFVNQSGEIQNQNKERSRQISDSKPPICISSNKKDKQKNEDQITTNKNSLNYLVPKILIENLKYNNSKSSNLQDFEFIMPKNGLQENLLVEDPNQKQKKEKEKEKEKNSQIKNNSIKSKPFTSAQKKRGAISSKFSNKPSEISEFMSTENGKLKEDSTTLIPNESFEALKEVE